MGKTVGNLDKSVKTSLDNDFAAKSHTHNYAASSHTHNYAGSGSAGGAANSATKLATARTLTIGSTGKTFDGSANVSWSLSEIGAAASSHNHSTLVGVSGSSWTSATRNITDDCKFEFASHINKSVTGKFPCGNNANAMISFNKHTGNYASQLGFSNNGNIYYRSADGAELTDSTAWQTIYTSANKPTPADIGAAASSHGTHVTYSTTTPLVAGTASVGSANNVSRGDHVHPPQTSVSGNAGTATKLATARTLTIGSKGKTFDGTANVSWSLSEIGAAAASHSHNVLSVKSDNWKDSAALPSTYDRGETLFFSNNPSSNKFNGLTYGMVQTLKEYGSGPAAWQFLYPYNAATDKFYVRNAQYNTDSWRSWAEVYTSLNKPTPADIGAAASSHGTHVTYSSTAPKIAGTAAVGSESAVARGDHVHPLQTSVAQLTTARTIKIGNKSNTFNGTANITYTAADMGVAEGEKKTATTAATAGWYRIATSVQGMEQCMGTFIVTSSDTSSGFHTTSIITAGICYGQQPNIQQLSHSYYGTRNLTKARIVYHTTWSGNYAYLEVYLSQAKATVITVEMIGKQKWSTVAPNTAGSIPSGYTSKEITFVTNKVVSNIQGTVSGNAGSATKLATARTITIGNKGNTFNGTADIAYTLADIGALPLTGGTLTGQLVVQTAADGTSGLVVQRSANTDERVTMYVDDSAFNVKYLNDEGSSSIKFTLQNTDEEANEGAGANTATATISGASGKSTIAANYFTENGTSLADKYAAKSHGTHVTWSTTAPKVAGTAAVGTETKVARGDHVHAAQTSVSGNAGTATKLATARTLTIGNKGKTFDGSANVSWTLAEIGALPLTGGTITGALNINYNSKTVTVGCGSADVYVTNSASGKYLQLKDDGTLSYSNSVILTAGNYSSYAAASSHTHAYLPTAGGTMTGAINRASFPATWVAAMTNSLATSTTGTAGAFQPMLAGKTTNGSMCLAFYQKTLQAAYITKANVDAGTNTTAKTVVLMDESGNGSWTGSVTATGGFTSGGNVVSDTALTDNVGSAAKPWKNMYNRYYNLYGEANKSYGNFFVQTVGTTSATGEARLTLGNNIATGTASNSYGRLLLYGTNTGYTIVTPGNNSTSNITVTLPSSGGTLARTADNVASATKLKTARTLTIGSTGKTFDGSANVSWTLAEIGAAAASHNHDKIVAASGSAWTTAVQNPSAGNILFHYNVSKSATGLFPNTNNANLIISLNRHSGNYSCQLGFNNEGNIYYRGENNVAISDSMKWKEIAFSGRDSSLVDAITLGRSGSGTLTADTYASTGKCYKFTSTSTATTIYKCTFAPLHFGSYGLCVRLKAGANTSTSNIIQIIVRRGSKALKTVSIKGTQFTSTSQYQNFYTNIDYVGDGSAKVDLSVEIKSTTVSGIALSFDYARIEMMNTGVFL